MTGADLPDNVLKDIIGLREAMLSKGETKVFVYGTLKRGWGNHRILEVPDAVFMGNAMTKEKYFNMVSLKNFPAVTRGGDCSIIGELYRVKKPVLDQMDVLEGHPSFYERSIIPVYLEHNTNTEHYAWCYFMPPHSLNKETVLVDDKQVESFGMHHGLYTTRYKEWIKP